ncbi:MAG: hypothetical protein U0929_09765 [Planctomycetaceae bacterium]
MRSLKVNAFAWLSGLALAGTVVTAGIVSAASPITDAAVLYSHQALDGNSYFAVSVQGPTRNVEAVPHDHVILIDTSASQVGEHRAMAMDVLKELLAALPATDRVQVNAIDVRTTALTQGFVTPQQALDTTLPTLRNRLPAGATDLLTALNTAAEQIHGERDSSIVYIGDAMSTAHLLQLTELETLVNNLRERHIPIHGFAVGANKDLRLLGTLAQTTGGMALIDDSTLKADAIGQQLAAAIDLPVIYPTSLKVEWDAQVIPQQPLPLRSDRATFYLARGQWSPGAALTVNTADGDLSWKVPAAKFSQGNQFLAGMWSQAEANRGVSVPFAGVKFLNAAHQSFIDHVEQLELAADSSLAKGDLARVEVLTAELRQIDPGNVHATSLKNKIGRMKIQTVAQTDEQPAEETPATEGDVLPKAEGEEAQPTEGEATPEPPAPEPGAEGEASPAPETEGNSAPPTPEPGDEPAMEAPVEGEAAETEEASPLAGRKNPVDLSPIAQEEARRKARTQKLRMQLESDIKQARQALSTSPEAAVTLVEGSRAAIKSATDIDADDKAQLLKQADSALTDLKNKQEVLRGRIQASEQRKAEQEAQQRVIDYGNEKNEKLKQLVDRIRALMDDGYHGDSNAFEEAEAVARIVDSMAPNSALGSATVFTTEAAGQLSKAEYLRSLRYDRYLETLYQVELAHVPFPDEPPVRYPPAAVWQNLTLKRKKWNSVDLHKNSPNEQKISDALDQVTSLEFPDNTLREVVDFISTLHNIPIRLDEKALEDEGVNAETRINLVVSGITLRSALNLLLEKVGDVELTYIVDDEVMKITTLEKAQSKPQTRVYPVGDLVIPIIAIQSSTGGGGVGGGGGGVGGGGGGGFGGGGGGGGGFGGGGGGGFGSVPAAKQAPAPVVGKKNPLN